MVIENTTYNIMTRKELTEKFASIRGVSHTTREFTPEEMSIAYINGHNEAIDKVCKILENVTVTYNKRFFGRSEERVFDDDFIEKFRETTKIKK